MPCPLCKVNHEESHFPSISSDIIETLRKQNTITHHDISNEKGKSKTCLEKESISSPKEESHEIPISFTQISDEMQAEGYIQPNKGCWKGFFCYVYQGKLKLAETDLAIIIKVYKQIPTTDTKDIDQFHKEVFYLNLINSSKHTVSNSNNNNNNTIEEFRRYVPAIYGFGSLGCGRLFIITSFEGPCLTDPTLITALTTETNNEGQKLDDNKEGKEETIEEESQIDASEHLPLVVEDHLSRIVLAITTVLQFCHLSLGIGHLDIKLNNITYNPLKSNFVLIDWNSAEPFISDDSPQSRFKRKRVEPNTDLKALGKLILRIALRQWNGTISDANSYEMTSKLHSPWKEIATRLFNVSGPKKRNRRKLEEQENASNPSPNSIYSFIIEELIRFSANKNN